MEPDTAENLKVASLVETVPQGTTLAEDLALSCFG